ncbi:disease resistance protein RPV1 [Eucalyptus grandis]|uniref:disease resistance protein RPV1 n=1 Tax=Eucalyptus grandis TaxID=71139 RepID=UPI00192EF7F0|nr:disease resistance protein RPV1 [Eucalyptus grandis]
MKRKRSTEAILSMGTEPAYQYDVFLSFCGGDTRLTFTDTLYHRMRDVGICVFLDSEELKKGKKISEVLKAVDESQIYIPIFSKKFASRSWCLCEVARMVECHSKSDGKREIIPIFYDVEPNDVKLISDVYKNDILKHKQKEHRKPEELEQWTRALKAVGSIMGLELKGKRHGKEIESILKQVLCKLNGQHVDLPGNLVEDHRQIQAIIEKLDLNSGGKQLLTDVSTMLADQIKDVGEGKHRIKAVCKTKRVLLVLDDLDKEEQLDKLAGKSDWFGSGSRIIITSRNKIIAETQGESSNKEVPNQTEKIVDYEVHDMEFDQALRLFCKHAFRNNSPTKDYEALSQDIVHKVAKLPLAIQVVGSYLYELGLAPEPRGVTKKLLEETLQKLDEGPFKDVQKVLMISYEGLEKKPKEVFLDIACFFTNEDKTYPIIMWDDLKYQPDSAICVLLLRSLIKIRDNKFWMHDQVRDLGRHIILEEHTPKFSRVWKYEDAVELLKRKEENGDVEALSLTSNGCSHNFTPEKLVALPSLRFIRVKESDFYGNFENHPSKLRWLSWQTQQMTFHVNNFHFSNLVVLDLSDSDIEDGWGGWNQMKMNKLKVLDLTGCMRVKTTPEFSNFTSLEKLILAQCVNLTTIDSSIDKLKLLETMNIMGCKSLGELPTEVGSLQALTEITMPRNFQPLNLPETFGNLKSLLSLVLDEHPGITRLPGSIGGLVKLERLSLCGCVGIKELPPSVGDLLLVELDISRSGIVELPDSIGKLKKLKVMKVSYTKVRKFPHAIGGMEKLEELHARRCSDLTDENLEEIKKLSHLRILDLSYTHVSRFPTVLGCLSRLQTLEMSSSHLPEVPDLPPSLTHLHMQAHHFSFIPDLSSLINLDYLELSRLTVSKVEPVPTWKNESPEKQFIFPLPYGLVVLKCRGISLLPPYSNLKNLSILVVIGYPLSHFSISEDLIHLRELKVSNCKLLMEIPGLSHLKNLQRLDLNRLKSLIEINGLSDLESLMDFRISHCDRIASLPNLSKLDKLQHIELEACPKIRAIKGIEGLESLKLDNHRCIVLERLLDNSRSSWLSRIVPKCQVFLGLSGPDTPYGIVDILYKNLVHKQIPVFRDDDNLSSGDEINKELLLALKDSRIYIPFLSKNYASSWSLTAICTNVP